MGVITLRFDAGGADLLRRAIEFALEDLSPWTDEELESFECMLEGIDEAIAEHDLADPKNDIVSGYPIALLSSDGLTLLERRNAE